MSLFPSPCGEVDLESLNPSVRSELTAKSFHPLAGKSIWKEKQQESDALKQKRVSIPLRGSRFGKVFYPPLGTLHSQVSIPLRGS